jgi:flagellar hook-associated protein 3 FlgL
MISSFFPVFAGRTSDPQAQSRNLYQVQMGKNGIQRVQEQLATGRRILTPSEEPTTSIRILQLQREQEFRTQALTNLNSATTYLNATESTLSTIQGIVNEMRGLTVGASTNLLSESEREGLLSEITASLNRLVSTANTKYQDRYLMAGSSLDQQPISSLGRSVRFVGDDKDLLTISDDGQYLPHNIAGQRALGLMSTSVVSNVDLAPAATAETLLSDLNGGNGVSPGAIRFSDGVEQVTIDLSQASNLNDVLQLINGNVTLSGREVTAAIQSNGTLRIEYSDGLQGTIRISDVGAGRAATDLGIATDVPAPLLPIESPSLDPILKLNTRLSQLNDGAGFDSSEGFRITQGDKTYTIVIGTAQTIEDVFNAVRRTGAAITADITPDGRNIRFRSTESGINFSIGENGGQLASRLGIRTLTPSTRLDQLNHGRGVAKTDGAELSIRRANGSQFSVDLTGSVTLQDVLNRINENVANQDASLKITATLNSHGNGITLSSVLPPPGTPDPQPVAIFVVRGAEAAWDLGLVPPGQDSVVGTSIPTGSRIVGQDPNPQEVKGVFNSLLRFREAVERGDLGQIARAAELFDEDLDRLTASRASLGVSLQQIDDLNRNHEDRNNDLTQSESRLFDADIAATIADLNGRQIAYEASLKLLAGTNRLNLFDFI